MRETLWSSGRMTASTNRMTAITPPTRSVRRSRVDSDCNEEDRSSAISAPRRHLDPPLVCGAGRIARDQVRLPSLLLELAAQAIERLDAGRRGFELERAVAEGHGLEHGFGRGAMGLHQRLQCQQEPAGSLTRARCGKPLLHLPAR